MAREQRWLPLGFNEPGVERKISVFGQNDRVLGLANANEQAVEWVAVLLKQWDAKIVCDVMVAEGKEFRAWVSSR